MPDAALPLSASLDHVAVLLEQARPDLPIARGFGLPDAFVDLPGIGGGADGAVSAAALRTMASLYFLAELEGTYLVATAEELARARFSLNLTDTGAAEALEDVARAQADDWIDARLRNQIYARVFGIGHADPSAGALETNAAFEPRMAAFASAIRAATRALAWGPSAGSALRVAMAADAMIGALGPRMQGNTLLVAERLSGQLRLALAALNHPGLTRLFQGRTAWDVVRAIFGEDVPDLRGHVTRAQTGLRLLSWTANHLAALRRIDGPAAEAAMAAEPQLAGWAEMWLDAAGALPRPTHAAPGWVQ